MKLNTSVTGLIIITVFFNILFYQDCFFNFGNMFKHFFRKASSSIAVNLFLGYSIWCGKETFLNITSLFFAFIYGIYIQEKTFRYDSHKGILNFLQYSFITFSFFSTLDFAEAFWGSVLTLIFIILLCMIAFLRYKNNVGSSKSECLEIVALCLEHITVLFIVSNITNNQVFSLILMVLIEEFIVKILHTLIMLSIKKACMESTDEYIQNRKIELLI